MSVESNMTVGVIRFVCLAAALVALIAPSGGQAQSLPGERFMGLGPQVVPPRGYLDFCTREPLQCPEEREGAAPAVAGDKPNAEYWRLLFGSLEPASYGRAKRQASARAQQRDAGVQVEDANADQSQRQVVAITGTVWKQLNEVNRGVNGAIRAVSDRERYGVNDYWALALKGRGRFGDCEDYVLEKRRALKQAGYSDKVLSIALVRTRWGQDHAVLVVSTDRGELVLDSLSPWITLWNETGYAWTARQSPLDPAVWVAGPAYFTAASAPLH